MRGTRRWLAALLPLGAALALVAAACGGGDETDAGSPSAPAEEADHEEEEGMVEVPPDAQEITVVGIDFAFDPAEFTARAGHPMAVAFENQGAVEHDWALRTMGGEEVHGAHVHAHAGEHGMAVFTLEPGTYEAWCTLPGHYEAGMKGEVTAE